MNINSELNCNFTKGCGCLFLLMFIGAFAIPVLQFLLVFSNRKMTLESERYVSSMNQAQQAYFGKNSKFSTSLKEIGIKTETKNYLETTNFKYSVSANKQAVFNYGISKNEKHKSHVGGVFVIGVKSNNNQDEIKTESILCVADEPGTVTPLSPTIQNGKLACGSGTKVVKPGGC
jgi:type IV pilus assembly protein PilA